MAFPDVFVVITAPVTAFVIGFWGFANSAWLIATWRKSFRPLAPTYAASNTRYKGWKLTRCGHREKGIIEMRAVLNSHGKHGRQLSAHRRIGERCARVVDSIAAPYRRSVRTQRRKGKSDARSEIIWIDTAHHILCDIGDIRQVETGYHVSSLHKSPDGRSDRDAVLYLLARDVQCGIKRGEPSASVVGGQIEFVSQAQVHCQSG